MSGTGSQSDGLLKTISQATLQGFAGEQPSQPNQAHFLIEVRDNGPGIPEDTLPSVFEPFFTTKRKGSGLGLASAAGIIRSHKGGISVLNHPDGGALFCIALPHCPPHKVVPAHQPSSTGTPLPLAGRSILLLEDQPNVRQVMRRHLTGAGADLHAVATGEEAVEAYGQLRESGIVPACVFDLIIEGGMGGIETLEEISRIWPDVRAIACSGHSEVDMARTYRSLGFRAYIAKPFTGEVLVRAILDMFIQAPA